MEREDDFKKNYQEPAEKENLDRNDDMREDLEEGDDAIAMETNEGEKITYGSTFSPMDGDIGDESEDINDLPVDLKKTGNRYDPTLSSGKKVNVEAEELTEGIEVKGEDEIGMAYGKDNYVDDEQKDSDLERETIN
jgi:hypothetical protein